MAGFPVGAVGVFEAADALASICVAHRCRIRAIAVAFATRNADMIQAGLAAGAIPVVPAIEALARIHIAIGPVAVPIVLTAADILAAARLTGLARRALVVALAIPRLAQPVEALLVAVALPIGQTGDWISPRFIAAVPQKGQPQAA